ncbi:MAG: hypothetical protein UU21_C0005G0014 [Candidatus Levybacteria bacterium GW2011_GWA2_40_8]|nr:MAG: hypothetical protein UU21_C0005G0014 [Candidatus Levybacteria bacterium GW2011_GWA2_40_8]
MSSEQEDKLRILAVISNGQTFVPGPDGKLILASKTVQAAERPSGISLSSRRQRIRR